jgi:hypothetical protein
VDVPPPPRRPVSYAAAANTPPAHLAKAEHVYVRVGGQQKPLAAPYAGPYLVVSKGAKTFTIQVGQRQEIMSVDRLKPHTGLGPVSPAEAASRGRFPNGRSFSPAYTFMRMQSGGGSCGGSYLVILNIFFIVYVSRKYGASEAIYLCNVVEKIHQYFRPKMRQMFKRIKSVVV